jgi:uncharacterized protein (TIGR00255 family)
MVSMTGYGKAKLTGEGFEIETEVKSVNAKFLDIKIYLPKELNHLDIKIRQLVTESFPRGTVELRFKYTDHSEPNIQINEIALKKILKTFEDLHTPVTTQQIPLDFILKEYGLIDYKSSLFESVEFNDAVLQSLRLAVIAQRKMAAKEGKHIRKVLVESIEKIQASLHNIEETISVYKLKLHSDMTTRMRAILQEVEASSLEQRIAQELAFYFDKYDIQEEIHRLQNHVEKFYDLVDKQGKDNVGKTLGFVFQEMQREANTLGSKFSNPLSFNDVIIIKEEVEKCREMILNVI